MGKCKFRIEWLDRKDGNGYDIKEWGRKQSDHEIFCMVCSVTINVAKGFQAVLQHSTSTRHQKLCRTSLHEGQLKLAAGKPSFSDTSNGTSNADTVQTTANTLQIYNVRDSFKAAELYWVLKCVVANYSFASCDGISELFACMFGIQGGLKVCDNFSMSSTKARYLLTDALAPYFKKLLVEDMAEAYYSICYDETTNNASSKELRVTVRYWSEKKKQIEAQHLQTFFIGSATGAVLAEKINEALDAASLPRQKLVMLGSDGPNVNKKVQRNFNEELMALRNKSLLNIGTCNIHILHNAFLSGLGKLGDDVSELVNTLHDFFSGWPSRSEEDFLILQRDMNIPTHNFTKHVTSRWLTLEGAANRVIEQWEVALKYFLTFVPRKKSDLIKSKKYRRIVELLKKPSMKAEVLFVTSSARLFTRFTGTFQKEEPMIHVMYDELYTLAKNLIGKICKPTSVKEHGVSDAVLRLENLLAASEIQVSSDVTAELSKLDERDRLEFLSSAQHHYVQACVHILSKSSLKTKPLLRHLRFLQPSERTSQRSCSDIVTVVKALPMNIDTDILLDEWKLLQNEKECNTGGRIDVYWGQFFGLKSSLGALKYPNVSTVVKAVLCLPHGSADVERGFSVSCKFLSEDKSSMSERTLNAALTVKSSIQMFDMKPQLVPMTKELLTLARLAHSSYQAYMDKRKKELENKEKLEAEIKEKIAAEEAKRKNVTKERKTISDAEGKLKILRKEEGEKRKAADKLFAEANARLKKAVAQKDMTEVVLAQAMLEGVLSVKKEQSEKKKEVDAVQNTIEKRKSEMISHYFSKKPKI